jgi:hypothetical protein
MEAVPEADVQVVRNGYFFGDERKFEFTTGPRPAKRSKVAGANRSPSPILPTESPMTFTRRDWY